MSKELTLQDVARALDLAIAMRKAQRVYFKDRSRENLIAAKQLEAEFDKAVGL